MITHLTLPFHDCFFAPQAGNDKYDLERAEREAKEKAMALLKAAKLARQQASKAQAQAQPHPQPQSRSTPPTEQQSPAEGASELEKTGNKGGQQLEKTPFLGDLPNAKKEKKKKKAKEQVQARKQARKAHKQAIKRQKQAARQANNQSNG